nr:AsmA family protein [uncultured Rhodopila sp.]
MAQSRTLRRLAFIGIPIAVFIVLAAIWNWDWFIPLVQSKASAALGRPVTIGHLHVRLRRHIEVVADDVVVANPPDWPSGDPPFVSIGSLTIRAEVLPYLEGRGLILPLIGIDKPRVYAAETRDGAANFRLATGRGGSGGPTLKIGDLRIDDGDARVLLPKLKTDFDARVATHGQGEDAKIVVDAKGTYAAQPITARLVGGALLSLRDQQHPWPIDLELANGPTKVALNGTLEDPLAFEGANVRLRFSGPDMGLLEPLVGFPIPKTPAYQIAGKLNLEGLQNIRFDDFQGRLGNSDIAGSILERPSGTEVNGKDRPEVTLNLRSNRLDLTDLNGFIGGTPGRATTANATPQQREAAAKARASDKLLPDTPISVPRLNWADIHLKYHGAHIEGRDMPLDDVTVALDVVNGRIAVHPVTFGIGKGRLVSNIDLTPTSGKTLHARADLRMQNLDVSRMMAATHTFQGAGSVSGVGAIDSTGDSLASLVGNGNGQIKMAMAGGNLSAVLVDLTGLHFGKALLSALGVPEQTPVQCFVGDLGLKRGVLDFNAMTLDTGEAITNVDGDIDLGKETIDLALKTDSKHFTVGSLPTRINIGGTFKDPSIRPGAEVAARAGAAAGLAALFAPLAILPTIQFGTSDADDARCGELLRQARASAGGKALPTPRPAASAER